MQSHHLIQGLAMLAKVLSAQLGIKLVIEGTGAHTQGSTVTLPALAPTGKPETRAMLVGYLYHEAAHVRYSDFSASATRGIKPAVHFLANVLEDPRIERRMWAPFPGARPALSELAAQAIDSKLFAEPSEQAPVAQKLTSALLYGMRAEVAEQSSLDEYAKKARAFLTDELGDALVTKIFSYARSGATAPNTLGAVDAAIAIHKLIKAAAEEEQEQPDKSQACNSQGNGQGNGQGQGGSSLKALADALDAMTAQDAASAADKADLGKLVGSAMSGQAAKTGAFGQSSRSAGGHGTGHTAEDMHKPGPQKWTALNADAMTQSLRLRVESILEAQVMEARNTSSVGRRFRRSRMIDSTQGSARIFERSAREEDFNAAVGVLVDCSGSMSGGALDTAMLAAACAGESVDWVARSTDGHVALAVSAFDTGYYPVVTFEEPWRTARINLGSVRAKGGTLYSYPARELGALLLAREETRRALIIISDGETSRQDVPAYNLVASDLEAQGVEIYGILIGGGDTHGVFKRSAVINSIEELPEQLATMLLDSVM